MLFGSPTATATASRYEDKVTVAARDTSGVVALVVDVTLHNGPTTRRIACGPITMAVGTGTTVQATPVAGRCQNGYVSSPAGGTITFSFHRRPPPLKWNQHGAPASMRWAVLIGIRDYAGRTHSTYGGTGDVDVIRTALLKAGWRSDHIVVLKDSHATASGIRNAFDWLAQRSTPKTFSFMHFSGHVCIASRGPCASGHTYLWSYDNHFLREDEVKGRMARVRGHSWLDIAGCESGAFDIHSSTRLFTSASRASETAYENTDWHQSYWSGLVWDVGYLQGLADDKGRSARATIGEMTSYGKRQAPRMTSKGERGPQHPVVLGGSPSWTIYAPPGG
jgi:hypothetical protein